jgi:putative transposase
MKKSHQENGTNSGERSRRIHLGLQRLGYRLNHKVVQRLMGQLGLQSTVRPKRYRAYRGEVGKAAEHLLQRNFSAQNPNEKWVTDVTEFTVKGQKVYLSPLIDLFNQEVVSYRVAKHTQLRLVTEMLEEGIKRLPEEKKLLLHSDQGWQYRNPSTQKLLRDNGIQQSMSRKGNCLDNAVAENFFGILKSEMYHGNEFRDADHLIQEVHDYIEYYNHKRIKQKLKGLSPVEYRNQALIPA